MDWTDIERLRVHGFTITRRGYDQREVDKFLAALADWLETDAAKDLGGMAVKRKLELAGKSTAQILLTTEREAEQMRLQTEQECEELRSRAETASRETRQAADDYAKKLREKSDQDARQSAESASAKAKRTIEEGERRRAQVEEVIAELDARRESKLQELQRLHGELGATIEQHSPASRPNRRNGADTKKRAQAEKEPDAAGTR